MRDIECTVGTISAELNWALVRDGAVSDSLYQIKNCVCVGTVCVCVIASCVIKEASVGATLIGCTRYWLPGRESSSQRTHLSPTSHLPLSLTLQMKGQSQWSLPPVWLLR